MLIVTGGAGFLGSHICRQALDSGRRVAVLDRLDPSEFEGVKPFRFNGHGRRIEYIQTDIQDPEAVRKIIMDRDIDEIVHTAAITFIPDAIKNPRKAFGVNILGTFNLLEAAREKGVRRFVYISTSSTYGDFQKVPADETHPLAPKDVYGATKATADILVQSYGKTYSLPVSIVRTSSIYGPGELEKRVVKNFVENALSGKSLELQGGGRLRRDFSYVEDVARGIMQVLTADAAVGEIFNITGGTDHSIREVAETVQKYIPDTKVVITEGRKIDLKRGRLDLTKAKRLTGYQPEYDLDRGIRTYIQWMCDVYAPACEIEIIRQPNF